MQQRSVLGDLVARRHTALLLAIIALFAVRPFLGDSPTGAAFFSVTILVVLLAALLAIQVNDMIGDHERLLVEKHRRAIVGWALAVPAVGERLWMIFSPNAELLSIGAASWLVFFTYVTWCQARSLLKQRTVTGETLSMAISIYLLIGLCWGILYILMYTRHPGSFSLGTTSGVEDQHMFPVLLYFSMTTLSTIGFGDITPLSLPARYAAVAEGITGQLYLAILVARLVGLQMNAAPQPHPHQPEADRRGDAAKP